MINKFKSFLSQKKLSKSMKQFALSALVCGCMFGAMGVNAYALDDGNTPGEAVVEYVDTKVFQSTITNVLDEGIDTLKGMVVPLTVAATGGSISVGLVKAIGRVVTKKVLSIAYRA